MANVTPAQLTAAGALSNSDVVITQQGSNDPTRTTAGAVANYPQEPTWDSLLANTRRAVGEIVCVNAGQLGQPELVKLVPAGTYASPDGVLVRNLVGSSGQAVSLRTEYASYAEFDADPRKLTSGQYTIPSIGASGAYVSSGQNLTTTAGTKVVVGPFHPSLSFSADHFGAKNDGVTDSAAALQTAINAAWTAGFRLYIPSGAYLISASLYIPPTSRTEYRGDSFTIEGAGVGSVFLGYTYSNGTTIIANTDIPLFLQNENIVGGAANVRIANIRFENTLGTASSHVMVFNTTHGNPTILDGLVIRVAGTGNGIQINKGYLTTIRNCEIANRDLASSPATRVGVGINLVSSESGGLFAIEHTTCRGFLNAYVLGNGTTALYATKMRQCECSTVTNGVTVASGMVKTVIDTCYFEGVTGSCVIDQGTGTTVRSSFFFEGYTAGIDSTYQTYGNIYSENMFHIDAAGTCIDVYADGDANGHGKVVRDNYLYFLTSGGTVANVIGLRLAGANPTLDAIGNTFRPRRLWVGGTGTTKVQDNSTGKLTGFLPITDSLNETPLFSNAIVSFAEGNTLTESSVTSGALAVGAQSALTLNFGAATNITSINLGGNYGRLLTIRVLNANATFVYSASGQMRLAGSNFTGPGMLLLECRVLSGTAYAFELARSTAV